jgi:hypothetical protein
MKIRPFTLCSASGAALLAGCGHADAAALALGFAGQAIGAAIGGSFLGVSTASLLGAAGTIGGALIDNMLFKKTTKIEGPRVSDLTVTASTYGEAIPLLYGPSVRLAGNLIWSSGLIEVKKTTKQGGKGGGGGTQTTEYTYHVHAAICLSGNQITDLKRIWANGKLIFDRDRNASAPNVTGTEMHGWSRGLGKQSVVRIIRFYEGGFSQEPDTLIESYLGAGNVPAYRGLGYVVLERLELADFGNVLPNLEFEIEAQTSTTVADVARDICTRAGVADASVSRLANTSLRGYAIGRESSAWDALQPLGLVYGFDVADHGGEIRFIKRGTVVRATIPAEDLAAVAMSGDGGTSRDDAVLSERLYDQQLPRAASFKYRDVELDYDVNSQRSERLKGDSRNNLSVDAAISLTPDEGRRVADRLLYESWAARRTGVIHLTERWIDLQAGEVIAVPVLKSPSLPELGIEAMRIERLNLAANGLIEVSLFGNDPEVYESTATGQSGFPRNNEVQLVGDTDLILLDAPILLDTNDDDGFYWAVHAVETGWRGASVQRSSDGGTTYPTMNTVGVEAIVGDVATPLATGPTTVWDRGNILTVVVSDGEELESLSELSVLNGGNMAWLGPSNGQGGEYLQFATATLISENTYQLSNLLRGRAGTEANVGTHGSNEKFVLMETGTIQRSDYSSADWNKARLFRPVSILQDEDEASSQSFTHTGEGKRPYEPVHIRGTRDSSNNLTLTWIRRTRLSAPGLGNGLVPLGEENEAYEVDIIVGASVVRTISVTSPTTPYSAAQQTADGITPGAAVTGKVYQISATRGRGRPASFTV